jgi:hypothetical protein
MIRTVDVSRMKNPGARINGALRGSIGLFVSPREAVWHRGADRRRYAVATR